MIFIKVPSKSTFIGLQRSNLKYCFLDSGYPIKKLRVLGVSMYDLKLGYKPIGPTNLVEWADDL